MKLPRFHNPSCKTVGRNYMPAKARHNPTIGRDYMPAQAPGRHGISSIFTAEVSIRCLCGLASKIMVLIGCLSITAVGSVVHADAFDKEIKNLENFSNVYHLIQRQYIKPKNGDELIRSAIRGMVKSLDPYSAVLGKKELERLEFQSIGKYPGIGVYIQNANGAFVVTQVMSSSPAALAGMKPGDIIVRIEGESLTGKSESELNRLFAGDVGTSLEVGYYHPKKPDRIIEREIKRTWIKANSVDFFEHAPEIAILRIHQFQKNTPVETDRYLQRRKYKTVILDLRNNPGGLLVSAVETAELFVGTGMIVETRDKSGQVIEKYISRRYFKTEPPFLVVLMNRFSASAAEILAGAIKDREQGILVGERSYGKGVVQTVFPLPNELYVKITTARYYSPSGTSFDKVGIEPDYLVKDSTDILRYGSNDRIFQKALKLVREKQAVD
ncbi:MAG: S41 family peptidase [Proteobacteria bacterium]|nr:S41 family peptidase [Pseudomonadota bacterium]